MYLLHSSTITKNKSNLLIIGALISIFIFNGLVLSYLPKTGLAAAKILVLVIKVAWIPALAILIVCCSIDSWIATWSLTSILSNSSIQQMPLSANIKAPTSIQNSPVSESFTTPAVRPAAELPFPLV